MSLSVKCQKNQKDAIEVANRIIHGIPSDLDSFDLEIRNYLSSIMKDALHCFYNLKTLSRASLEQRLTNIAINPNGCIGDKLVAGFILYALRNGYAVPDQLKGVEISLNRRLRDAAVKSSPVKYKADKEKSKETDLDDLF